MGQKVNPHGMRVGVIKDWDSRWYASNEKVGDLLVEDKKIRDFLKKSLYNAQVPKIEIERSNGGVTVYLHCARPGMVIGKEGKDIEATRLAVEKMIGKPTKLNIVEVRNPDMNAQLVAENKMCIRDRRWASMYPPIRGRSTGRRSPPPAWSLYSSGWVTGATAARER